MKRNIKKMALAAMLAGMLGGLTGCFIQPDPTLDPLQISDGTVPFGTVQALPTNTPTPVPQNTPTPTPDTWQSSDQSTWEDWSGGSLPTTTPKTAATVAPGAQSWQTSTQDYNAGYPVLRVGSTGSDVSDLQARLTELGYYTGTIDGKYSTGTQSAVTEFQSRNGLTADGIAGRATQDKLYSASAQPKTVSASAVDSGYTLLKEGASGLEVRKLQGRLAELGYYAGGVDGIYGSTTTSAVKAFQRANGLSGDGQAGSQTQTKLYSASAKYAASPVATANPDQTRTLTVGMTGNDVYALQERLIELNYLSGVADGVFGAETQNALTAFQSRNGLTADGTAGASTLKKLNGSCKPAAATAEPSGNGTMREGDTGEDVYTLQARLFELGYYNGRIDGRYSSETTAAVKAFQKANGLGADGIAGKGTMNKLNSGNAVAAETTDDDIADEPETTYQPETAYTVLRRGDKSDQVEVMQRYLATLGYLSTTPDGQALPGGERAEGGRRGGQRHALHLVQRKRGELQCVFRRVGRLDDRFADSRAGYDDGDPVGERRRQRAPISAAAGRAGLSEQQICDRQIQPEDRGGDEGLPDDERLEGGRRGGAAVPQADLFGRRAGRKRRARRGQAVERIGYRDGIRRADGGHERRTGAAGAEPIGGTGVPVRLFYKRRL